MRQQRAPLISLVTKLLGPLALGQVWIIYQVTHIINAGQDHQFLPAQ
jgi:hypothetical protein